MNAIKFDTTVTEATVSAIPALRPMLGKRIELIALQTEDEAKEGARRGLTLSELLALRRDAPPGAPPLTDDDIQRAVIVGALRGNV